MNQNLIAFFHNRLDSLVASYAGEQAIIAVAGLGPEAARELNGRDDSLAAAAGIAPVERDDGLDSDALFEKHAVRACRNAIEDAEEPLVCLFEQLKPLAGALAGTYEGTVVVAFNDLFAEEGVYPSPLSSSALAEAEKQMDSESAAATSNVLRVYASLRRVDGRWYANPLTDDDWSTHDITYITANLFFNEPPLQKLDEYHDGLERVSVSSVALTSLKYDLTEFESRPVELVVPPEDVRNSTCASQQVARVALLLEVAGECHELGVPVQKPEAHESGADLLPLLKRYWGADAGYRLLKFYKDPDRSMELEEVSQGVVIDYVVTQAEAALAGTDDYTDIFVTAPTGAGKSLLFQLPALYLGEHHKALTIVIEPLKALMNDQAEGLRDRGVTSVAVLNGDMSFSERTEESERVRSGEVSILYLAPEMLLSSDIKTILGSCDLAMVVVDEAHTVASWGKDFRPDYWYLGAYLSKLRKNGRKFPIFCLTATAVYGGVDDVVKQTISDLELVRCKTFLGNVRRNDIAFDIKVHDKADFPGPVDEAKKELAIRRAKDLTTLKNGQALIYCPFRRQVETIMAGLDEYRARGTILGFHAGLDKTYKDEAQRRFQDGSCKVMVCTKAWGMGIDVDDIVRVYHYAPTGNISDYIQEIGRAARREGLSGRAQLDFFQTDANYYCQLYTMSGFTQVQLREVMRKLYALYQSNSKKSQNMLVSPESFSYLFPDEKDLSARINKARSALLMVAKDFENKCNYPVVVVSPRTSNTKNFVCIPDKTLEVMQSRYGSTYAKLCRRQARRTVYTPGKGSLNSAAVASDIGNIYELNSARLWEDHFAKYSFADFKRRLYSGEILGQSDGLEPIAPRTRLTIAYAQGYEATVKSLDACIEAIEHTLCKLVRSEFDKDDFEKLLKANAASIDGATPVTKNTSLILKSLTKPYDEAASESITHASIKCIRKMGRGAGKKAYYAVNPKVMQFVGVNLRRSLSQCRPNEDGRHVVYLNRECYAGIFELAEFLEVLGLAEYENRGGSGADLFVRLNSPAKLNAFTCDPRYKNSVLADLQTRHRRSTELITRFFTTQMSDEDRWDLVEHYFLGHDDYVAEHLNMPLTSMNPSANTQSTRLATGAAKRGTLIASICSVQTAAKDVDAVRACALRDATSAGEVQQLTRLFELITERELEKPDQGVVLQVTGTGEKFCTELAWPRSGTLLLLSDGIGAYVTACQMSWHSFMLSENFDMEQLLSCLKKEKKAEPIESGQASGSEGNSGQSNE